MLNSPLDKPFDQITCEELEILRKNDSFKSDIKHQHVDDNFLIELVDYTLKCYYGAKILQKDEDFSKTIFAPHCGHICACLGPNQFSKCSCMMDYYRYANRYDIASYIKTNDINVDSGFDEFQDTFYKEYESKKTELDDALKIIFKKC